MEEEREEEGGVELGERESLSMDLKDGWDWKTSTVDPTEEVEEPARSI